MPVTISHVETIREDWTPEKALIFNIDLETVAIPVVRVNVMLSDKNNYIILEDVKTMPGSLLPKTINVQFRFVDENKTVRYGVSARGFVFRDGLTT